MAKFTSWFEQAPSEEQDIFAREQARKNLARNFFTTTGATPEEVDALIRRRNKFFPMDMSEQESSIKYPSVTIPQQISGEDWQIGKATQQEMPTTMPKYQENIMPIGSNQEKISDFFRNRLGKTEPAIETKTGLGFLGARVPEEKLTSEEQESVDKRMSDVSNILERYRKQNKLTPEEQISFAEKKAEATARGRAKGTPKISGRMLNPDEVSSLADGINEGTVNPNDLSKYHYGQIMAAYRNKYPSDVNTLNRLGQLKVQGNTKINQAIDIIRSITEEQGGNPSLLENLVTTHKKLGTTGDYGIFSKALSAIAIKTKDWSNNPDYTSFEALRNSLASEISSALASGGVPTDMKMKTELENLRASSSPEAFEKTVSNLAEILKARVDEFQRISPRPKMTGYTPMKKKTPSNVQFPGLAEELARRKSMGK